MRITVVGAGVVGLTVAVELEKDGHRVEVVSAGRPEDTVSAVAGAIWYPYRAGPPERVNAWAARTRAHLEDLARDVPEAGVDVLTMREAADASTPPWWAPSVPELIREEGPHPFGAPVSWRFRGPRVEPGLHLAWLEAQLASPLRLETLTSLDALDAEVVVNCTGLGARTLADDEALQAVYGQVVITEPGEVDMTGGLGDERDPRALLYVIPRRREVVLGGCALPWDAELPPEPSEELSLAILTRAQAAGVTPGRVLRVSGGLRPVRPTVRLERAGRVIHCYGHGGAGYTLAFGCARDVAALVRD